MRNRGHRRGNLPSLQDKSKFSNALLGNNSGKSKVYKLMAIRLKVIIFVHSFILAILSRISIFSKREDKNLPTLENLTTSQ